MRKTKIVCTIGPACRTPEAIEALLIAGMNVARLNFSHSDFEEHRENIRNLRAAAAKLDVPLAILQDLSGPKIRIGEFACGFVHLNDGDEFVLTTRDVPGDQHSVHINYKELPRQVQAGDTLLLADGALEFAVLDVAETDIRCQVVVGGPLSSNKGINLPNSSLEVPSLTEKDRRDLAFGLEQGVDFVALSFVRSAKDVRELKAIIAAAGYDTPVIAKIEKHEAVQQIDEIIQAADGLMVARGDLGIEIRMEKVPMVQKMIINRANVAAKPVITATQMLRSMVEHPRPTRAEVTDVANAVLDGSDALMLSEETAIGAYSVAAVTTMARICDDAEQGFPYEYWLHRYERSADSTIPDAISHAACHLCESLHSSVLVVFTQSGGTARLVTKFRPRASVLGVTPIESAYRRMALCWGVHPRLIAPMEHADESVDCARREALAAGLAVPGGILVITGGVPVGMSGTTNSITTETIR